jgi:hypothetical protein
VTDGQSLDPARQIFITSTTAAADACAELLGVQAIPALDLDWDAMPPGCRVVLWPNNTKLALIAAAAGTQRAHAAGAASVKMVEPGLLTAAGWGADVALAEGWSRDDLVDWLRQRTEEVDAPTVDHTEPPPEPAVAPVPPAETYARAIPWDDSATAEAKLEALGIDPGKPPANEDTVMVVLERHPAYRDAVWSDSFLGRIMTRSADGPREWADADDVAMAIALQRTMGLKRVKVSHVRAAVIARAMSQVRNCAQDWLAGLKWDGTERIADFFPDICGTPNTLYARAVGRNFWLSLVARVLQPGCKVDTMVILEGAQGSRKSSLLKAIGGDWYCVQHEAVTGKGFFEVLPGKMLVEIAEMDAFGKAEVTRVKQVVSTESDRYRESYGRYAKDHPRHSIFVGTTNKDDWNRDETGARRFWPIRCADIDVTAALAVRSQLFAEAVAGVRAGATWWEMPADETLAEQDARREDDPWCKAVGDWMTENYRS